MLDLPLAHRILAFDSNCVLQLCDDELCVCPYYCQLRDMESIVINGASFNQAYSMVTHRIADLQQVRTI